MSKISISLAGDKRPDAISNVSESRVDGYEESQSRGKPKGKGGKRSPRQQFFSELMKRLAGDSGNSVAEAFMNDKKKFKGMMMGIVSEMAKVDDEE